MLFLFYISAPSCHKSCVVPNKGRSNVPKLKYMFILLLYKVWIHLECLWWPLWWVNVLAMLHSLLHNWDYLVQSNYVKMLCWYDMTPPPQGYKIINNILSHPFLLEVSTVICAFNCLFVWLRISYFSFTCDHMEQYICHMSCHITCSCTVWSYK